MGKQKHKAKKPARSLRRRPRVRYPEEQVALFVSEGHYTFWLAHGANYLASPLTDGLWKPIFDIYSGRRFIPERLLAEVAHLYQSPSGVEPPGQAILGWCSLKPNKVFGFYKDLCDKATIEQRERLRDPHVEYVWQAFQPLHRLHL